MNQDGVLVRDFGSNPAINAGGAAFAPDGTLYVVDHEIGALRTLNTITGAIETTTPLIGTELALAAADFDPLTGHLVAYSWLTLELIEIDAGTGQVLSATDMSDLYSEQWFPTSLAFNADGSLLFFINGYTSSAGELVVLKRVPEPNSSSLAVVGLVVWTVFGWRRRNVPPGRLLARSR